MYECFSGFPWPRELAGGGVQLASSAGQPLGALPFMQRREDGGPSCGDLP